MDYTMIENGGVTTPAGFVAAGVAAGIKESGQPDIALLVSDRPATVAGAFTSNLVTAAPVILGRETLRAHRRVRAVIANSGNANACTGAAGLDDARAMAARTAECLKCKPEEVLVSSTGRIGVPLPMDTVLAGISAAAGKLDREGGSAAAVAIMTTDTYPKTCACEVEIDGRRVTVGGMTKGAGLVAPKMEVVTPHATVLTYITTDAEVDPGFLRECLGSALPQSFNRVTVDGDMSTNDTMFILANGAAGNAVLSADHPDAARFRTAIHTIAACLARELVLDAEGATKFVEIRVSESRTPREAEACARAVANSVLCKTAWFGQDPNWGRILDAAGYSGAELDPESLSLDYNGTPVVRKGVDAGTAEKTLADVMQSRELKVDLKLGAGVAEAVVWTCDLSYEYVKINADYGT